MTNTVSEIRDTNGSVPPAVQIARRLAEPFEVAELRWKPGAVRRNRALALAERLEEVLGVDCWQDEYECLANGSVVCKLRCRIGGQWIVKSDVGGPSEQEEEGDRTKAAFSDGAPCHD